MSDFPTICVSDRLVRYVHPDQCCVLTLTTRNRGETWTLANVFLCHLAELLFRKLQIEKKLAFPGLQNIAIPCKVIRFEFPDLYFLGVPDSPDRRAMLKLNANDIIKAVTRALQSADTPA